MTPKIPPARNPLDLDSAAKFHAVWEALAQYVDNADEPEEQSADQAQKLAAANELIMFLDAKHAALAEIPPARESFRLPPRDDGLPYTADCSRCRASMLRPMPDEAWPVCGDCWADDITNEPEGDPDDDMGV